MVRFNKWEYMLLIEELMIKVYLERKDHWKGRKVTYLLINWLWFIIIIVIIFY